MNDVGIALVRASCRRQSCRIVSIRRTVDLTPRFQSTNILGRTRQLSYEKQSPLHQYGESATRSRGSNIVNDGLKRQRNTRGKIYTEGQLGLRNSCILSMKANAAGRIASQWNPSHSVFGSSRRLFVSTIRLGAKTESQPVNSSSKANSKGLKTVEEVKAATLASGKIVDDLTDEFEDITGIAYEDIPEPPEEIEWDSLSEAQIRSIFPNQSLDVETGNALLKELQSRRVFGSLAELGVELNVDDPQLAQLAEKVNEDQALQALEWLRATYPIDEAAAAIEYEQRNLYGERPDYAATAVKWGLLKNDALPPEGYMLRQPGEEKYGHSVFMEKAEEWKRAYEERSRKKEEELKVLREQQAVKNEERRVAIVEERMKLEEQREDKWKNWEELKKKAEIDTDRLVEERSAVSRLWRPTLFGTALLVVFGLMLDSSAVTPPGPASADLWKLPTTWDAVPPSMVTCGAILALNLVAYLAWKHPRFQWTMNRYFMLVAGHPNSFSVLGSMFSHQFWLSHLAFNTAMLFTVGMPVHEEVGWLNFVLLYLSCGIFGSLTALYWHVLRRNFYHASIGASGAVWGLLGAYFTLQPERKIYVPFTDHVIPFDSWWGLVIMALIEARSMQKTKGRAHDHAVHIGGGIAGMLAGYGLRPASVQPQNELQERIVPVHENANTAENS